MKRIFFTLFFCLSSLKAQSLSLLQPSPGQIITTNRPSFSWSSYPGASKYDLSLSLHLANTTCGGAVAVYSNISATNFVLPTGITLEDAKTYCLILNAKNDVGTLASSTFYFRTKIGLTNPQLTIAPMTSPQSPSGARNLVLSGRFGEEGAWARTYLRSGSIDIEVSSQLIHSSDCFLNLADPSTWNVDPVCSFEVLADATRNSSDSGERRYFVVVERTTGQRSAASNSVSYYFDPRYSLGTPVLQKVRGDGVAEPKEFQWSRVDGATHYRVYRRKNQENCSGGNCFFNKPFQRMAQQTSTSFIDTPSGVDSRGVSYFVTAVKLGPLNEELAVSNRSRVVTYQDNLAPLLSDVPASREEVLISASRSGRSVSIYYCNVDSRGFLNSDNSPDLAISVLYFPRVRDEGCNRPRSGPGGYEERYLSYKNTSRLPEPISFDALSIYSDRSQLIENCVPAGEIADLAPDTPFCFSICQRDDSGNQEINCTNTDQRTLPDRISPSFLGLNSAHALSDGRSVQVRWDLALEDRTTNEVIQYQIQSTSEFTADGMPIFVDLLGDPSVITVGSGLTSVTATNLKTATRYCFQATALDDFNNRNTPPDHYVCATTLDNRPSLQEISFQSSNPEEPYQLSIKFKVVDREAEVPGHFLRFEALEYRLDGGEWKAVERSHLSGNLDSLKAASSLLAAPFNEVIFNTLPYFSGEHLLELRMTIKDELTEVDLAGNAVREVVSSTSQAQSQAATVFPGMSRSAAFSDQGVSGCTLKLRVTPERGEPHLGLILLLAISILLWFRWRLM